MTPVPVTRILIYRLGSIGDFVVALPCLHLIRRRYPIAQITLLTNRPVDQRAAAAESLLAGAGLVDQYLTYNVHTRNIIELNKIARSIRSFTPNLVVYLSTRRTIVDLVRDYLFLKWGGMRISLGFPFKRDLRTCHPPAFEGGLWEAEAHRLARCIAPLGDAEPEKLENWDLNLSDAEMAEARRLLYGAGSPLQGDEMPFISLSVGTKQDIKDWGEENWRSALSGLGDTRLGLVLIGAENERTRSQEVASVWPGPVINLCGVTSPRVSAAALSFAKLLLCHDSGPMHLAAAVGTRCVAVFSKKNRPGEWYPFGEGHKVLYPPPTADSIEAILPRNVIAKAREILSDE